jgi:hypothetical protein
MTSPDHINDLVELSEWYRKEGEAALLAEKTSRDLAWVDDALIPVAGVCIRHFTLHDMVVLSCSGNAFLTGSEPTIEDVINILWYLSPNYKPSRCLFVTLFRKYLWFYRSRIQFQRAVTEINEYLDESLLDMPNSGREEDGKRRPDPTSWIVPLVHIVAETYGLDPDTIKHKPIARVLQLHHEIMAAKYRNNGKEYTHIGKAEGRIASAYLKRKNEILREKENG